MALLYSTLLYHGSTWLLSYSFMVLFNPMVEGCIESELATLPRFYFSVLDSTVFYHGCTLLYLTLYYSFMVLLQSILDSRLQWLYLDLYITLQWFYFTLLYSTLFYHDSTVPGSTILFHGFTSLYYSTGLYIFLQWVCFTLLDSTAFYHGSTSLYLTLQYSFMDLLHPTRLYIIPQWLYFTLDSALLYLVSTSLYLTPLQSTIALLHSTWLYVLQSTIALLHVTGLHAHYCAIALLYSTWLNITLWSYFIVLKLHVYMENLVNTWIGSYGKLM